MAMDLKLISDSTVIKNYGHIKFAYKRDPIMFLFGNLASNSFFCTDSVPLLID